MLVPDERAGRRSLAFVGRIGNPSCRAKSTDCQSILGAPTDSGRCSGASRTRLRGRQRCGLCQDLLRHPRIEVRCVSTPVAEHSHGTKRRWSKHFFEHVLEYRQQDATGSRVDGTEQATSGHRSIERVPGGPPCPDFSSRVEQGLSVATLCDGSSIDQTPTLEERISGHVNETRHQDRRSAGPASPRSAPTPDVPRDQEHPETHHTLELSPSGRDPSPSAGGLRLLPAADLGRCPWRACRRL